MRGVHYTHLSNIVDFIYHGQAEVVKDDLETFLKIGQELGIKGMIKAKGLDNFNPQENVSQVMKLSEAVHPVDPMLTNDYVLKIENDPDLDLNMDIKSNIVSGNDSDDKSFIEEDADIKMDNYNLDKTIGDNLDLEEQIDALVENKDGVWVCLQCGKWNDTRFRLRRHVETHLSGFSHSCQHCDKTFPTRGGLDVHTYRAHPENKLINFKTFFCDTCNKPSSTKAALQMHKARNHR